ncbi:MAG: four helix bundle protein [Planctomycetaceae bacterium]
MSEPATRGPSTARTFEELWIWQQARSLVPNVYRDFADDTAAARDFGFRSQIQRAAVSIMNNIAEGFERQTDGDFARFLDIAKGSAGEVRSMYFVAEDQRYVTSAVATERRNHSKHIASGISSLASHLRSPT